MAARCQTGVATGRDGGFTPYEKMPEDTNCWETRKLNSIKKWVALEKVHGANLSFTVRLYGAEEVRTGDCWVGVAKRSGYIRPDESFFGVRRQTGFLEGQQDLARVLFAAVLKKHPDVVAVTICGELFGGKSTCCLYILLLLLGVTNLLLFRHFYLWPTNAARIRQNTITPYLAVL